MRNISYLLVCVFCLVSPAFAASYQAGDRIVSFAAKMAVPGLGTSWGEFNVENMSQAKCHDAKLGSASFGGELQGLYFVAPWLAAGLQVGAEFFGQERSSGWEQDVSTFIMNYMAAARVYVNPNDTYKVYVPLGIGAAHTRIRIDMHPNEVFAYTGLATHFGLGVERGLSERSMLGFEVRYNTNHFQKTKTVANGDVFNLYPRANYIS